MTKYSNDRHVSKKRGSSLLSVVTIHNPSLTCISFFFFYFLFCIGGFPGSSASKESACNAGDLSLIPGVGRIPWRRGRLPNQVILGFPGGSVGKESACSVGDPGIAS